MISSNKTVQLRGHSFAIDVSIVSHESLTVTLAGEGSAWRGSFSAQYIEDVTKKTGNFKRFSVFAEMVQAALEGSAPGLALDLISAADLAGTNATTHTLLPVVAHERLYLVVTYAAAFDRCVCSCDSFL
ncbi:hypothetical protein BCR33DRAFT_716077 [Rhizoclosmatium globosum]|uniref:Uncharacterized protein n=1 Tax=Rhizoclosmatium globosum TaxID=329046 RepID=A0A1Y2CG99_9FUNG|nr:hypothetical protein BCR33DRAFT_716077 [Rhizoclosmatium globosum]|eukprot:ORY46071.1 hypothetical protein BCR33DRAFT_716077 [Rhizoclosmatium globosum]